jgi:hypothetical protein
MDAGRQVASGERMMTAAATTLATIREAKQESCDDDKSHRKRHMTTKVDRRDSQLCRQSKIAELHTRMTAQQRGT